MLKVFISTLKGACCSKYHSLHNNGAQPIELMWFLGNIASGLGSPGRKTS